MSWPAGDAGGPPFYSLACAARSSPRCGSWAGVPTRLNRRIPESRLTRPGRESESDSDAMARRSEKPPKPLSGTASLRFRAGKAASEAAGGRRQTRRATRWCRSASRSARRRTGGAARHPREREWASRLRICSSTKDRRNSHGNFALNSSTVPCTLSSPWNFGLELRASSEAIPTPSVLAEKDLAVNMRFPSITLLDHAQKSASRNSWKWTSIHFNGRSQSISTMSTMRRLSTVTTKIRSRMSIHRTTYRSTRFHQGSL